ncbi:GntR family transcriptional regulator [Algibacter pacificus]|uniref:GntR family transcriptional regulator n=1 Tax=Algibacter pacificus TaxID=2599389 RepID=UPI0011CC6FD1|nr:GntR family transcriptional regulator [Algibacter pacificus]
MEILQDITIKSNSSTPKYKQIVNSIIQNIIVGNLRVDQKIPSINLLSEEYYLSRDTVEKAYKILKEKQIITSIRGKGYYINRTKFDSGANVLFLINKLNHYKLPVYNYFIKSLGQSCNVDLKVYHCEESLFLNILEQNIKTYDYYIIMPHFKTENNNYISCTQAVLEAIKKLPPHKTILIDNKIKQLEEVSEVYQDFENDIYNALKSGLNKINKYKKIFLIYPKNSNYPYPKKILHGFRKFCVAYKLDFEILDKINPDLTINKGELFITIEEADLVHLIEKIRDKKFAIGTDVGIISYNDTPLKALLGITVFSADFKIMGEKTSQMILNNEKGKFKVPFNFIDRNSI